MTEGAGLLCWGINTFGLLGNGSAVVASFSPVFVADGIASVSAGALHNCAVTIDGGAMCWGSNAFGQLGDGTTVDRSRPTFVVGLESGVVSISANDTHSCAVMATGGIKCWGHNVLGQLGDGTQIDRLTPVDVGGAGVATPPSAPTSIGVTSGTGIGVLTVSFTAPVNNGGAPITVYTASCSAPGQQTRTAQGTGSPLTVNGLTLGVAYACAVTASNSAGTSLASVASAAVTLRLQSAAVTANLNGDGKSTLTWRNTNGAVTFWRYNGNAYVDTGVTIGPFPGWSLLTAEADFDGDGKSDLLWLRTDGAISIWLMNGTTVKSQFQSGPFAGWSLFSANSDFNGDGKTDLIWQRTDGAISLWAMNGGALLDERVHGPFAGWSLLSGNNDFDGDGKSDLLWKRDTGSASLWLMNGVATKQVSPEFGPFPGWTVVSGSSDYNGDGKTDLTWEKRDNAVSIWLMSGVSTSAQSAQLGPFTGWRMIPGRRDFDGDGKSDLLWQRTDGAASVWLMNGAAPPAGASISAAILPSGSGWQLLTSRTDFNGDGKTDLVWQTSAGQVAVGLANGVAPPALASFGPFAGWSHFVGKIVP